MSDFHCWQLVLDERFLATGEREYEERSELMRTWPPSDAVIQSCERLFDHAFPRGPAYCGPLERTQAAFGTLRRADVQAVRPFASRKRLIR